MHAKFRRRLSGHIWGALTGRAPSRLRPFVTTPQPKGTWRSSHLTSASRDGTTRHVASKRGEVKFKLPSGSPTGPRAGGGGGAAPDRTCTPGAARRAGVEAWAWAPLLFLVPRGPCDGPGEKSLTRRGGIRIGDERNRAFRGVLFVCARSLVVSAYRDASAASRLALKREKGVIG